MALGFAWATSYFWLQALDTGTYYVAFSLLFPAFSIVGVGMSFFPIDGEEMMKKFGVNKPQNFGQYPTIWKVIIIVSLVVGAINLYFISGYELW